VHGKDLAAQALALLTGNIHDAQRDRKLVHRFGSPLRRAARGARGARIAVRTNASNDVARCPPIPDRGRRRVSQLLRSRERPSPGGSPFCSSSPSAAALAPGVDALMPEAWVRLPVASRMSGRAGPCIAGRYPASCGTPPRPVAPRP
jgi:hypothetical protein